MTSLPDDRVNGQAPSRAPAVAAALAGALQAMRGADNLLAKLMAVRDGAADLDRLGDDGSGALDELSDSAIHVHNLDPNDVQTALSQGVALALEARGRAVRANGNGAGYIAAAAARIKAKSFTIDGEAVVLGPDRFFAIRRPVPTGGRSYGDPLCLRLDRSTLVRICPIFRCSTAKPRWRGCCAIRWRASC